MNYIVFDMLKKQSIIFDNLKDLKNFLGCTPRAVEKALKKGTKISDCYIDVLYEGKKCRK